MDQTNTALDQQLSQERMQRLTMQQQLADSTLGRVDELGLLPKPQVAIPNDQQPSDLGKSGPIGPAEGGTKSGAPEMLPPKPSAVVQVPQTLQGVQIPKNPDVKQWDDQDKQAWAQLSPQQKKDWVANRSNVAQIANAEAQKAARPQAWWQNWINSLGRGASSEGLLMSMQGTTDLYPT